MVYHSDAQAAAFFHQRITDNKKRTDCSVRFVVTCLIELFLRAESHSQTHDSDGSVQIVVCLVDGEDTKDAAVHRKSEDRDKTVDDSKDDEIQTCI